MGQFWNAASSHFSLLRINNSITFNGEGARPIFDRDELRQSSSSRVQNEIEDTRRRSGSRSPSHSDRVHNALVPYGETSDRRTRDNYYDRRETRNYSRYRRSRERDEINRRISLERSPDLSHEGRRFRQEAVDRLPIITDPGVEAAYLQPQVMESVLPGRGRGILMRGHPPIMRPGMPMIRPGMMPGHFLPRGRPPMMGRRYPFPPRLIRPVIHVLPPPPGMSMSAPYPPIYDLPY